MAAAVDIADDSDSDEGEVPPLLGPGSASTPTVASRPAAEKPAKKEAPTPPPASDAKPAANCAAVRVEPRRLLEDVVCSLVHAGG